MVEKVSDSAMELREIIEKAIEDHVITREEYDKIIYIATKDGYLDRHEQALLRELQQMIEDKSVRFMTK
ncbi:MAG: hypothetical protein CSA36_04845 [Draconibacterium sp.]|nr:MAG: hypothetical protein CSA36_04845 [Draconibacterium sp.]